MSFEKPDRDAALDRLEPLVGTWEIELVVPGTGSSGVAGRCVFEWTLDRRFLVQRSLPTGDGPPESLAIIAVDSERDGGFTQHYFDERGVVRVYAMRFRDGLWELVRDTPDFSPYEFTQRFTGLLHESGDLIEGRWERGEDEERLALDFELTYRRVPAGT